MITDLDILGDFMDSSPPSSLSLDLNTTIVEAHHRKLLTSKFMNSDSNRAFHKCYSLGLKFWLCCIEYPFDFGIMISGLG